MTPFLKRIAPSLGLTFFVSTMLMACHTPQPDVSEAVGVPAQVYAPVINEPTGDLFLQKNGLWAFVTSDQGRKPGLVPGQVVAFGDLERTPRHLFATVDVPSWGIVLQRLDVDPIVPRASGSLIPLSNLDRQTGRRWRFCSGIGTKDATECLTRRPTGTRWQVFPVESAPHLEAAPEVEGQLPYRRSAQAIVTGETVEWLGARPREGQSWLALPTGRLPLPPHANVAMEGCTGPNESSSLHAVEADIGALSHPLTVESKAYELAVDALLVCEGDATLYVPSLYRPPVVAPDEHSFGPPLVGTRPQRVRTGDARALERLARFGAATATGDWVTADLMLELLARQLPEADLDALLTDSMLVAIGADRPEAALRMAEPSISSAWNPESSPRFLLGLAAVERTVGMQRDYIARMGTFGEALERSGDTELVGWMTWLDLRDRLHRTGQPPESADIKSLTARLGDASLETWKLAVRAEEVRLSRPDALEALREGLNSAGAGPLWKGLAGREVQRPCESGCRLDSYGRKFHAFLSATDRDLSQLHRVPRLLFQPGYSAGHLLDAVRNTEDRARKLALLGAALPILDESDHDQILNYALRAAQELVADGDVCNAPEQRLAPLADVARLTMASERTENSTAASSLDWLLRDGIAAACQSTDALAKNASQLMAERGDARVPASLFEALLRQPMTGELAFDRLKDAAGFAARYGKGEQCKRWNLVLASTYAEAGYLDEAERYASRSTACSADDAQLKHLEMVIMAFVNYEKTLQVSADFDRDVRRNVLRIVYRLPEADPTLLCVGLHNLKYGLVQHLPEDLRLLAQQIPLPERELQDLDIVTARHVLGNALEDLESFRTSLGAGDVEKAAEMLVRAREGFEKLEHRPGIARTRFLSRVVFGGEPQEFFGPEGEEKPIAKKTRKKGRGDSSKPAERLRSGAWKEMLDDPEVPPRYRLAAMLLGSPAEGDAEDVAEALRSIRERAAFDDLCVVEERYEDDAEVVR